MSEFIEAVAKQRESAWKIASIAGNRAVTFATLSDVRRFLIDSRRVLIEGGARMGGTYTFRRRNDDVRGVPGLLCTHVYAQSAPEML